jgi:hypothetical protein
MELAPLMIMINSANPIDDCQELAVQEPTLLNHEQAIS